MGRRVMHSAARSLALRRTPHRVEKQRGPWARGLRRRGASSGRLLQITRHHRIICMMWIPRNIEPLLTKRASQRPVVVVTGARQTGKTSLVRRLFPNHDYVSLDLPSEAEQASQDPRAFLTRHPRPLIVDEVQYAP